MARWGIALLAAGAALAGCGGDDDGPSTTAPRPPSVGRFLGPLPLGYREAPAPRPDLEKAFRDKVARDFHASEVVIRNVYLGSQFVAGELAVRASRPLSVKAVADKALPGHLGVGVVTIAGKKAYNVVRVSRTTGQQEIAVIDTVGPVVLMVTAERYPLARKLAARFVR